MCMFTNDALNFIVALGMCVGMMAIVCGAFVLALNAPEKPKKKRNVKYITMPIYND